MFINCLTDYWAMVKPTEYVGLYEKGNSELIGVIPTLVVESVMPYVKMIFPGEYVTKPIDIEQAEMLQTEANAAGLANLLYGKSEVWFCHDKFYKN